MKKVIFEYETFQNGDACYEVIRKNGAPFMERRVESGITRITNEHGEEYVWNGVVGRVNNQRVDKQSIFNLNRLFDFIHLQCNY